MRLKAAAEDIVGKGEMASEEDAWGDLFAQAGDLSGGGIDDGLAPSSTSRGNYESHTGDEEEESPLPIKEKKRKKKNRKRRRPDSTNNDDSTGSHSPADAAYQAMLAGRMDAGRTSSPRLPWWLTFGHGLLMDSTDGERCSEWKREDEYYFIGSTTSCRNCRAPAAHHTLQASRKVDNSHRLFVVIRNLRCLAGLLAAKYEYGTADAMILSSIFTSMQEQLEGSAAIVASAKTFLRNHLPQEEMEILNPKVSSMLNHARTLLESLRTQKRSPEKAKYWEHSFNLITGCDALYYRLYYLQLTRAIPPALFKGQVCFFPHPLEYFRLATATGLNNADSEIVNGNNSSENVSIHPLEAIHELRKREARKLFNDSGWRASSGATLATLKAMNQGSHHDDFESKHGTCAAKHLVEWWDGCRDLLCNLYAYATVSSDVLDKLMLFLEKNKGIVGATVVEVGAGTGYIAKLLQERGVQVEAWDIQPPRSCASVINEYHGQTPTFVSVRKQSKLYKGIYTDKVLMLCYPPPGSSMAYDTLKEYLKGNGKCLIHIGEFKGLTGDSRFEVLLTKHMTCFFRRSCLTWGTDASHVTFWLKDGTLASQDNRNQGSKVLLPCTSCGLQEAVKRCRLERNLAYCTSKCCSDDSNHIEVSLKQFCVPMQQSDLIFSRDTHFALL